VRELIAAFARAGHSVVLAAQSLNKSPWEKPAEVPATILQSRPASDVQSAAQKIKAFNQELGLQNSLPGELRRILYNQDLEADLIRRFDSAPPDFIYERASLYGTAGAGIARALRVPRLVEVNAPIAIEQSAYRGNGFGELAGKAERWSLEQADTVLAVSAPLRDHILSLGIDAAKVHVVPNGVDPTCFCPGPTQPETRTRFGLKKGPLLGFVGGLRPWHGVEVLPDLLSRLSHDQPDVQLVIAGDGPLRAELETAFRLQGLSDQVTFLGAIPHEAIAEVLRCLDVGLAPYPALDHSFYFSPLKVFEYMACGVAMVAADCGQIGELVEHDKTGSLYPAGDLDALTKACRELLEQPKRRLALGQAAAAFVREHFTWDHNARRVIEFAQTSLRTTPPLG
jgi:glycosyltransferase involved in cell wall biosynthesis